MNLKDKLTWLSDSLSVWESDNYRKILSVFFNNADKEFQTLEIWSRTRIQHEATLRLCLTQLRSLKWLTSRREGKEVYYKANEQYFLKVKKQVEKL